jgi:hypothetical protein
MHPSKAISTHVVAGSMLDEAQKTGQSLANTWLNCKIAVLCDGSGSMYMEDSRGHKSRFSILKEELIRLQGDNPGAVAVISFSEFAEWNPDGMPVQGGGSTNLLEALRFVKAVDGTGIKIAVISDGEPDDEQGCLSFAKTFQTKIDAIYVGPENEHYGRDFLRSLTDATGGKFQDDFKVDKLADKVVLLLGSGG